MKNEAIRYNAIRYNDDLPCNGRHAKFHSDGYKNVYSVRIKYVHKSTPGKTKCITMDYGRFSLASTRFDIETSTKYQPETWLISELSVVVVTYEDMRKVGEDVIMKVLFGTENTKNSVYARNRLGEVVDK